MLRRKCTAKEQSSFWRFQIILMCEFGLYKLAGERKRSGLFVFAAFFHMLYELILKRCWAFCCLSSHFCLFLFSRSRLYRVFLFLHLSKLSLPRHKTCHVCCVCWIALVRLFVVCTKKKKQRGKNMCVQTKKLHVKSVQIPFPKKIHTCKPPPLFSFCNL